MASHDHDIGEGSKDVDQPTATGSDVECTVAATENGEHESEHMDVTKPRPMQEMT